MQLESCSVGRARHFLEDNMAEIRVEDINLSAKENPVALINAAEQSYHGAISAIADKIAKSGRIKVVFLSGPSGAGKTTTANLLSDYVKARVGDVMVVSLDDFYRNASDPAYPRYENGERNFEAIEALDLPLLSKTLSDIAKGLPFEVPKYDFKVGGRTMTRSYGAMERGCVIIEGLHALNPLVFSSIPEENALKIFISVSTNVTKEGARILSGRKIRFVRRMIRDSLYRGASAKRTLDFWDGVLRGEDEYLYPTRKYADVNINTFHPFELSVMRPFALDLITEEFAAGEPYAKTVLNAIKCVEPIDIDKVPEDSLIREFIPGGKYEHLY